MFLTNKLPSVRAKLKIDVEHLRAHNPKLIYVRGTGQGERGPDADRGSYDALAYWCRAGIAMSMKHADDDARPGAARPRVRRLDRGDDDRRRHHGRAVPPRAHRRGADRGRLAAGHRPLVARRGGRALAAAAASPWVPLPKVLLDPEPARQNYKTKDERFLSFCCLQAAKYWPGITEVIGQPELATDERFADAAEPHEELGRGRRAPRRGVRRAHRRRVARALWRASRDSGRWCRTRSRRRTTRRPSANGYVVDCQTAAGTPFKLAAAPVQYDEQPADPGARARVQRARRRDPPRARPRLGRDPRSQGARSRGVILKAGTRLKSAVCDTEVMVIAAPAGEVEVSCGGAPMLDADGESGGALDRRRRRAARRSASAT